MATKLTKKTSSVVEQASVALVPRGYSPVLASVLSYFTSKPSSAPTTMAGQYGPWGVVTTVVATGVSARVKNFFNQSRCIAEAFL